MSLSRKRWFAAGALVVLPGAAALWVLVEWVRPFPPAQVVMVTGTPGSDYSEVGMRYRAILAQSGITLELVPTAGALENLSRLKDRGRADAGFLQGGTTTKEESPDLVSLGTVFYEPLWFFVSEDLPGRTIQSLRGRRISVGMEGSGGRALTLKLLGRMGLDGSFAQLLSLPPEEAERRLMGGEIDGATMMESWDSPVVKRLLASPRVRLMSFPHTDAYLDIYPFLNKLVVPAAVGDLIAGRTSEDPVGGTLVPAREGGPPACRPPVDTVILAPKASLVVRRELHPAIQYLLLKAAAQVHSGPGIFRRPGQFPAEEAIDLPLSDHAAYFYRSGQPFLQRHLPFWLAVFLERTLVLLIPIVGLLYSMLVHVPALKDWWFRRKVFMLYGKLRFLEDEIERGGGGFDTEQTRSRIDRLEGLANHLKVPLSHAGQVYSLKEHIASVKRKLRRLAIRPNPGGPSGEDGPR